MEQFFQAQVALLQNLTNTVAGLQANQGANNNNQPPRSKLQEFMTHRPPSFSHTADPMQAEDWLKTVGKMLDIAQCTDREKVLYASGRLEGTASDWWDAFVAAHATPQAITWQEFQTNFRNHHIPAGLMKLKKREFLTLKQGGMTVSEYRDKFIQLSRYAPESVDTDEKKQEAFLEGLIGPLNYQLTPLPSQTFRVWWTKPLPWNISAMRLEIRRGSSVVLRSLATTAPASPSRNRIHRSVLEDQVVTLVSVKGNCHHLGLDVLTLMTFPLRIQ
ncbi:unnamed protein product [Urochloa humidicola]